MLEAASTGRWPRTGLDLSSRRWIRRWLRLRRFRRMAFTRNPFLLELMLFGHIHQTPQNTKDFEFFSEFHPSEGETFAWLRTNKICVLLWKNKLGAFDPGSETTAPCTPGCLLAHAHGSPRESATNGRKDLNPSAKIFNFRLEKVARMVMIEAENHKVLNVRK